MIDTVESAGIQSGYLSQKQAAERLNCSRDLLRKLTNAGRLPASRVSANKTLYGVEDIARFLESTRVKVK